MTIKFSLGRFSLDLCFNVLGNLVDFEELDVLDLFSGTGSISYEFCSRGARSVTSVEVNSVHNAFIRKTVIPLANSIAQELTKKLLISPDMYFRVNERKLYSYSLPDLAKVADDQYVRGLMDGNEVRDWLGMAPRDGLDQLVMLENYIPADQIGDQKKLKQEGTDGE